MSPVSGARGAGAIYWAGIGRVVYGLSGSALLRLGADHPFPPTLDVPCRTVFAGGLRSTEVVGPALEGEAAIVHRSFWHRREEPGDHG